MAFYDALLGFGVLLFLGTGWAYLRHPAASFYHPLTFYLAMHGIVFTLRPILARGFDYRLIYDVGQFHPSIQDKITVLLATDLALVVFATASLAIANRPVAIAWTRDTIRQRELLWIPFVIVTTLLAPVALYSVIDEWLVEASNASTMAVDIESGVIFNTQGNGWLQEAQTVLVPLVAMFAWLTRFRWYSYLPFVAFFILRAGTGGRGPIIVAAAAIVILFLLDRARRWPEWRGALLILIAALAFNAIVQDRGKAVREAFIADEAYEYQSPYEVKPFEHMDFANLEYFEFAVYAVPQRSGTYDYFLHALQLFTEPVPRVWWKEKPLGPPIPMYHLPDYGRPYGYTYSVPGIGWMALGWPGVVIQTLVFALIFGGLHRRLARRPQSPVYILVFTLMIAGTVVSYRDGTLLTIARNAPFYLGPIAMMWAIALPLSGRFGAHRKFPQRRQSEPEGRTTPAERRRALARLAVQGARHG